MSNIKDLTGSRVGILLLLERKRENNRTYYFCRCDCGNEKWIRADMLGEDKTNNCGCSKSYKFRDLTGEKFGRLTAIKVVGSSVNNGHIWECQCDCGNYKDISMSALVTGKTLSCGCYQKSKAKENVKKAYKAFKDKHIVEHINLAYLTLDTPIKSNKSGITGVYLDKKSGLWKAFIGFKKKKYHLGYFKEKDSAIKVRKEAEEKLHHEFLEWYYETIKKIGDYDDK